MPMTAGLPGCGELQGIIGNQRADGPGIEPAVGRGGDRLASPGRLDGGDASKNCGQHGVGAFSKPLCRFLVAGGGAQRGGASQAGHGPEIVPVVKIVGTEMLGAEPGGSRPSVSGLPVP